VAGVAMLIKPRIYVKFAKADNGFKVSKLWRFPGHIEHPQQTDHFIRGELFATYHDALKAAHMYDFRVVRSRGEAVADEKFWRWATGVSLTYGYGRARRVPSPH
jgi:hypothetical protein